MLSQKGCAASPMCSVPSVKVADFTHSLLKAIAQLWAATHLLAPAQLAITGGSFRNLCLPIYHT